MKKVILLIISVFVMGISSLYARSIKFNKKIEQGGRHRTSMPVVMADVTNGMMELEINRFEGKVYVKIFDAFGNVVLSDILQTDGKTEKTLDLSGYENGQYFIEVGLNDITYSGSFDLQ